VAESIERPAPTSGEVYSLAGVIRALRRRWALVTMCFLAVAGSALVFSLLQEKRYSATASLLVRDLGLGPSFISDPAREVSTNVQLAALGDVAVRTAEEMDQRLPASEIAEKVEVQEQTSSDLLDVVATDSDPGLAAELANSFADSFVASRNEADRAALAAARRRVEAAYSQLGPDAQRSPAGRPLRRQIGQLRAQEAAQTARVEVVQEAVVPTSQSSPQTARNTVFGGIVGLFIGVALALLVERRQERVREPVHTGNSPAPAPLDRVRGARVDSEGRSQPAPPSRGRALQDDPEAPAPRQRRS
jgi:polysaccharide biosynthesis transport protein